MGFDDRRYAGGSGGGGFGGAGGEFGWKLWRILNWSFPIGTYFGVVVRVHITFVLLVVFWLLFRGQPVQTLRLLGLLFGSVLLHEFGHIFGCRYVGGHADRILMWPLGGLAYTSPPQRWKAHLITVAAGPAVTLGLMAIGYGAVAAMTGFGDMPVSWNPFSPYAGVSYWELDVVGRLMADLFVVNYILFLFNVFIAFYPFDGGQLIHAVLWSQMGYRKSLDISTTIGMVGAVILGIVGVLTANLFLAFIAVFGFMTCYRQKQAATMAGPEFETAYMDVDEFTKPRKKQGFFARRRAAKDAKKREKEREKREQLEAEVDRILEKVHKEGMHALSEKEKKTLKQATESKRGG